MSRPSGDRSGFGARPHFVLKRGYRGRYRFTFISGEATLSGDVQIDSQVGDREEADRLVRRKILEAAGVFALWMERTVAGEHEDARALLKHTMERT